MYQKQPASGAIPKKIDFYYLFEDLFNINSMWSMYKAIHKLTESGENLVDSYSITEDERDIFTSILSDATFDVFTRFLKYTKGVPNAILFNEDFAPNGAVGVQAKVDTVSFSGTSGKVNISCANLVTIFERTISQTTDEAVVEYVNNYADSFLARGVILSNANSAIRYTSLIAGADFISPVATTVEGDLVGTVVNTTPNISFGKYVVVTIVDHEAYNANYLSPVDKILEKCLRFYVLRDWFMLKDMDGDAQKADISYKLNLNLLLRHSMQLKKALVGNL